MYIIGNLKYYSYICRIKYNINQTESERYYLKKNAKQFSLLPHLITQKDATITPIRVNTESKLYCSFYTFLNQLH